MHLIPAFKLFGLDILLEFLLAFFSRDGKLFDLSVDLFTVLLFSNFMFERFQNFSLVSFQSKIARKKAGEIFTF